MGKAKANALGAPKRLDLNSGGTSSGSTLNNYSGSVVGSTAGSGSADSVGGQADLNKNKTEGVLTRAESDSQHYYKPSVAGADIDAQ